MYGEKSITAAEVRFEEKVSGEVAVDELYWGATRRRDQTQVRAEGRDPRMEFD